MQAYAVQDATGMVKLDAMENPFGLPDGLKAELGRRLGQVAINRYPGARVNDLKEAIRSDLQLGSEWGLLLGNGSDELISLLAIACDIPGASVLAPEPGFVMYGMSALLQGLTFHGVSLTENFELDESAMVAAIEQHRPAITYLAYPNNPTANLWSADAMVRLIEAAGRHGGIVVIDEAYQPFSSQTWLERIKADPDGNANVLLMRTLSKFGLAGVRIGYMVGPRELIAQIDKVRPPYNVSVLNAECGLFALEHATVFAEQADQIRSQRQRLQAALAEMPGVTVFPSEANMVLVRVPDAAKSFAGLKSRGILVKNVSTMHTLLGNCLRLTVGTPEETDAMIDALQLCL